MLYANRTVAGMLNVLGICWHSFPAFLHLFSDRSTDTKAFLHGDLFAFPFEYIQIAIP